MKKILTASQMKACDEHAICDLAIPSRTLMQRAAFACVEALDGFDLTKTYVLCGVGNNGGDGLAIADILASRGVDVTVIIVGDEERCSEQCEYRLSRARDLGITVTHEIDLSDATTIIDAIFGVGLTRAVESDAALLIEAANKNGAEILAVDVPSGIGADSGALSGVCINAKRTVAIQNLKPCHVLYPAARFCGEIRLADIGIPDDIIENASTIRYAEASDLCAISPRPAHSHKGTFGRVLVIAGSAGMAGAAYFSAFAAYRTGAGLVEIMTVGENRPILQTLIPEAIVTQYDSTNMTEVLTAALGRANSVVCGPGLGVGELSESVVRSVIASCKVPLVLDADALNIIAEKKIDLGASPDIIITPHLGEMSRLTGDDISKISADLVSAAKSYAKTHGVICVLKDSHSIISDGEQTYINLSGCSAMAKGGSGDVLTGIIAALLAGGVETIESAVFGCMLHGTAGQRAADKLGAHAVLARDIANNIKR